ncbi:carboxymuconolactone decarboxylase family protein [Stenotrophomonas sp. 24(2023)]|uniref:carboxymuconolactone decarboxylase family protein n=1 Tax=Stenotrophomonas sp. 24(2023) TaxID=3068324 RepID=UPI0027E19F76|nr:carboxymuconolactone decarboxylase family protein [Stenotrophomonas sp. 24(2023)]WMJ68331.1 carboxymuconolactone decarboxylase family protein [Stenotrophomonas sp. 24(2023)]
MSRLSALSPADATGLAATLFTGIKKAVGKVPNAYATIGTHSPESLAALLALDEVVGRTSLGKTDIEAIRLAVSAYAGCDYCVAAHSLMGRMAGLSPEALQQIRSGGAPGTPPLDALTRYVRTLVSTQGTVPQDAVEAVQAAGYTDRQLIEIALVIASITFTNLVNRTNDTTVDFPAVA